MQRSQLEKNHGDKFVIDKISEISINLEFLENLTQQL